MASSTTLMSLPTYSSPNMLRNSKLAKRGVTVTPSLATFPSGRCRAAPLAVRAQSGGGGGDHHGKDSAVDVQHVKQGGNASSDHQHQGTAMEKRPRKLALDISPFGNFTLISNNLYIYIYI